MAQTNSSKTPEELEGEIEAISRQQEALQAKKRELKEIRDAKVAEADADRVLAGLSPGQIDAVAKAAAVRVKGNGVDAG